MISIIDNSEVDIELFMITVYLYHNLQMYLKGHNKMIYGAIISSYTNIKWLNPCKVIYWCTMKS